MVDVNAQVAKAHRELTSAQDRARETLAALDAYRGVLSDMPDAADHVFFMSQTMYVIYRPSDESESNEIRSGVQKAIGGIAKRTFNAADGTMVFTFEVGGMSVTIYNGSAAPNCTITPYETTVTRYRMDCPEGEEATEDEPVAAGATR